MENQLDVNLECSQKQMCQITKLSLPTNKRIVLYIFYQIQETVFDINLL